MITDKIITKFIIIRIPSMNILALIVIIIVELKYFQRVNNFFIFAKLKYYKLEMF